uniref:Pericentrin/AKAP-450 centrosomal targeting domain-containing protein n=1 Tax=Magallana gigas TaxID=29159 RepID=A0A8W8M4U8_MAGGI
MNEKERSRDTEKVTERRSQRQLERERDGQKMKMKFSDLTQRVLDLEDQVSETREREMEATRELQQEKLRSTQQRVDSEGSEEDPDHWNVYKTQLENTTCLRIGHHGQSDESTQRSGREPASVTSLFVSRLTEEKMELRNTLGRLEEEIWRYRQRGAEQQVCESRDEYKTMGKERGALNVGSDITTLAEASYNLKIGVPTSRSLWATWFRSGEPSSGSSRLIGQREAVTRLALNQMEQELDQCRADLRVERDRRSGIAGVGTEGDRERIQRLYGKYLRADSYRKALVYQKKYLLLLLGGFQVCEQTTLALIARMGVYPSPEDLQQGIRPRRLVTTSRNAATVVVAVSRMRYLVRKWNRTTRVGFPVMGGIVDLQQGYTPNSNSFSPLCINTQSHLNDSGPFNSHASLYSSVHQSPYSPSYLSSSFTQRDLLNGASPYHSLRGSL